MNNMLQKINQIIAPLIILSIPICFAILYFILIHFTKKYKKSVLQNKSEKNKFENLYAYHNNNYYVKYYFTIVSAYFIALFVIYFTPLSNLKFEIIINLLISCSLTLTGISIALLTFTLLFNKDNYICFSVKDILNQRDINFLIITLIISLLAICFYPLLLGFIMTYELYSYLVTFYLLNMYSNFYIIYILFSILLFNRSEYILLNQLNEIFNYNSLNIDISSNNDWNKKNVEKNLFYIWNNFIELLNNKKIRHINKIIYFNTNTIFKDLKLKKAQKLFKCFFLIPNIFICIIFLYKNELCIPAGFLLLLYLGILFYAFFFNNDCIDSALINFFIGHKGYIINENQIVSLGSIFKKKKYVNYINTVNNLNAFFYIWIYIKDGEKDIISKELNNLILELEQLEQEKQTIFTYFPIFTIGFFLFDTGLHDKNLQTTYKKLSLTTKFNKKIFNEMITSQLMYLTNTLNQFSKVNNYLIWLEGSK